MQKENLYFIAIIPPKEICDEIEIFKNDFAVRFSAKQALKQVAHITLKAPFRLPVEQHDSLLRWFIAIAIQEKPFELKIENFSSFRHNKVIFIKPLPGTPLLALHKSVIHQFEKEFPEITISEQEKNFHPHITVAYRDLSANNFTQAWKEYKSKKYTASFIVHEFHLLQHDNKKWNVIRTREM
jgi:2'-5' RNA ligase